MKIYRNQSSTMQILLGLVVAGCFLPLQVRAQATDIHSFVDCVNTLGAAGATVDQAATSCIPSSGCYYTNTLSEESAQPGCTLRDGTKLPRVIFSCTGPGANQRFRPSFSLCTLGADSTSSVLNHIELGEDSPYIFDHQRVQKMGDILLPSPTAPLTDTGVQAGNGNHQTGCANCHDLLASVAGVNYFGPIPPKLADGTISTNDPTVVGPANPVPLSAVCAGILSSTQLAKNPSKRNQAYLLCQALLAKEH